MRRRPGDLSPATVRQALANPYITARTIAELIDNPRLRRFYEVRREIAAHPHTPQARAISLVAGLYWRDLARIGCDSRVRPAVRRAADRRLAERMGRLSVGEKVVLAREAGPGLIPQLLQEPDARLVAALLENPRLTEPMLAPLVTNRAALPEALRLVAEDRRWGARYAIRAAICGNPRTPPETALSLLAGIKKSDLSRVASDPRIAEAVRQRAELLLGDSGGPGRRR